jgi:hypothetical protein
LGGSTYEEEGTFITVNNNDQLYVTGLTWSSDFPTTAKGYDTTHNVSWDIFVSKFDKDLSADPSISITSNAGVGGSIVPLGNVSVSYGTDQRFTITPDTCHWVTELLIDGVPDPSYQGAFEPFAFTFENVVADHTIDVNFQQASGIISMSGYVRTVSGEGIEGVILEGLPGNPTTNRSGYYTASLTTTGCWSGTVIPRKEGYSFDPTHRTYINLPADLTEQNYIGFIISTITSTASSGGDILPAGEVPVRYGEDQSFIITPDPCYRLSELLIDSVAEPNYQGASETFIYTFEDVIADHTIEANFQQASGTITASAGPGGSISPEGIVEVPCGEDQSFTMTPNPGYDLDELLVDGSPDSNYQEATGTFIYTFENVIVDHTIEARFQEVPETFIISGYIRTTNGEGIEGILLDGFPGNPATEVDGWYSVAVPQGWSGTVTPQKQDYTFAPPSRTYQNVIADQTNQDYTGSLTPVTHTITATAGSGGNITPSGNISVNEGDDQNFTITADEGYMIEDVTVDGVSEGPISTYSFTNVITDHTIEASFMIASGPIPTPPPIPTATPPSQPIPEPTAGILLGLGLAGLLALRFRKYKR